MSLTLVLNGQSRTFPKLMSSATLEQVVEELGLKADRIAVELNGTIVPRLERVECVLKDGDRLELVHFVGGGMR